MEPLYFFIVLILFFALPAILRRLGAKGSQPGRPGEEAKERPEYRASVEEMKRFLRGMGIEAEEEPEGPGVRPPQAEQRPPAVKPAQPRFIEEGREPGRRPRRLAEPPPRPAPEVLPAPGRKPRLEPAVQPIEEVRPEEAVPLLETVSEAEPLIREAARLKREVGRRLVRPPRPARAGEPPARPLKKEVSRVPKILPVRLADLPRAVVMAEILGRPRGFGPYRPHRPPGLRGAEKR